MRETELQLVVTSTPSLESELDCFKRLVERQRVDGLIFARTRKADERILLSALRRLSLDNQIAIELYHFEGMTGPQLAEVLDLPEPAVRSRLRRALEQLREHAAAVADDPNALADTQSRISQWARDVRGEVA